MNKKQKQKTPNYSNKIIKKDTTLIEDIIDLFQDIIDYLDYLFE